MIGADVRRDDLIGTEPKFTQNIACSFGYGNHSVHVARNNINGAYNSFVKVFFIIVIMIFFRKLISIFGFDQISIIRYIRLDLLRLKMPLLF